jgi:2-polyprenyl-6-methoxyphenol hydroxylase-like FAD-dependent oxidoreductase
MEVDVLIRGDGCVGRSLALALAAQGLRVALRRSALPRAGDLRAYALNAASQALLARLRVWDGLPAQARTPVTEMRVQAEGGKLDFSAWTAETDELAWIVDAAALDAALDTALRFAPHVQIVEQEPAHALLALCEGREAGTREQLGIQVERRPYGHDALATRLLATQPHQGRAWQWFLEGGEVLALLPLDQPEPGRGYALVWSQPEERAAQRRDMDAAGFEQELLALTGQSLQLTTSRQTWPLQLLRAQSVAGPGYALLGDCAHLVHPLAGQGLNLGLADVTALAQVLAEREAWRSVGDAKLLRRYERARAADTWLMGALTDGLWAGFTQAPPWARQAAAQGLSVINQLTPLKRWLSRRAMGHSSPERRA